MMERREDRQGRSCEKPVKDPVLWIDSAGDAKDLVDLGKLPQRSAGSIPTVWPDQGRNGRE